jgi:uncharacterized protein
LAKYPDCYTYAVSIAGGGRAEEESRTVRLLAAAGGLLVGLTAVPASAQEVVVARIHDLQGAAHLSPFSGQDVSGVEGIVTVERSSSFPLDL